MNKEQLQKAIASLVNRVEQIQQELTQTTNHVVEVKQQLNELVTAVDSLETEQQCQPLTAANSVSNTTKEEEDPELVLQRFFERVDHLIIGI